MRRHLNNASFEGILMADNGGLMDIFWLVPVCVVGGAFVWGFYLMITREAGDRKDGKILTDKPSLKKQ